MQSFWYCLDCNAPLPERDESCRLCKQTWEQQHSSGPNYYELWTDADFAALDREIDYLESKEREHHEVRMQNYAKKKEAEAWWRANG